MAIWLYAAWLYGYMYMYVFYVYVDVRHRASAREHVGSLVPPLGPLPLSLAWILLKDPAPHSLRVSGSFRIFPDRSAWIFHDSLLHVILYHEFDVKTI